MPSMHVGLAFLFWLAMRETPASKFFLGFYVVIFVGSVHLAYHYAVDGIVSTGLVALLWWASGRIVKKTSCGAELPRIGTWPSVKSGHLRPLRKRARADSDW